MTTCTPMAMRTVLHRFLHDNSAATAIEYGLIASLIAVAIIAGATALGTSTQHDVQQPLDEDELIVGALPFQVTATALPGSRKGGRLLGYPLVSWK